MTHWMEVAHSLQVALVGFIVSPRGLGALRPRRLLDRAWLTRQARRIHAAAEKAFRESAREEKVALLGLVLVLAALTWP